MKRQPGALRRRREANAKRIAQLERMTGAWHRARLVREFHHALVATYLEQAESTAWMLQYANQVDPLHPTPRDPDWEPVQNGYFHSDEEDLKRSLIRLTGQQWHALQRDSIRREQIPARTGVAQGP